MEGPLSLSGAGQHSEETPQHYRRVEGEDGDGGRGGEPRIFLMFHPPCFTPCVETVSIYNLYNIYYTVIYTSYTHFPQCKGSVTSCLFVLA